MKQVRSEAYSNSLDVEDLEGKVLKRELSECGTAEEKVSEELPEGGEDQELQERVLQLQEQVKKLQEELQRDGAKTMEAEDTSTEIIEGIVESTVDTVEEDGIVEPVQNRRFQDGFYDQLNISVKTVDIAIGVMILIVLAILISGAIKAFL